MRPISAALVFLVALLLTTNAAYAWLRPHYEDTTVVERSELIVVAHLKEGSIQYVPHEKPPGAGASWEHHATLLITDVLKGKSDEREIPIIIHYGLTPLVGGHVKRDNFMMDLRMFKDDYPKDIIEVLDTGNSIQSLRPLVEDARQDNVWFLRKRSGLYGREPGTGKYGIVDREDLQPLRWKDYFLAYMADDPETAVKECAKKNPGFAIRAQRYFDHLEVQRALKTHDPEKRCNRLLPFFLNGATWNMQWEARNGICLCGNIAGQKLREVFDDPHRTGFRTVIILMWRDIGYREAVPLLIDLLKKHDEFWAQQDLQKGWWNTDVGSSETRRRRQVYSEVYYGVCALRSFKDPAAKEILSITRDRWKTIGFDNPQIVEECEAALREF